MRTLKKVGSFSLLPPIPGVCQECAVDHAPDEPHDQQSLYYQYSFYADHDRWPTWTDAMAHCPEETRRLWTAALQARGIECTPSQ